jgi:spore maturation protein CgeB
MRFALFYHSLVSDWNHGNAHFLRGIVSELLARGHHAEVFEPADGWSRSNLLSEQGAQALEEFHDACPGLHSTTYGTGRLELDRWLDRVDVVLVHEWTAGAVVAQLVEYAAGAACRLLFHDTHHRAVSDPNALQGFQLDRFDGVLAFGASLAEQYRRLGWGRNVWVWHEAADTRVFYPRAGADTQGDLVWVGNWGDAERARELHEFLIGPVAALGIRARVHGVRYPIAARRALAGAGIEYGGWVPNYRVPDIFSRFRATIHVPRGPYVEMLPGIPTIRPFEAMACGIPLISAPWPDTERLFDADDYLTVSNGREMTEALRLVLHDRDAAAAMAARALRTIRARHTCAHRVDQLMMILREHYGLESGLPTAGAREDGLARPLPQEV